MVDRTPLQSTMSNYMYRCIPMQCYYPMSSWPLKEHRTAVLCCTRDQVATLEQLESIWRDRSDGLRSARPLYKYDTRYKSPTGPIEIKTRRVVRTSRSIRYKSRGRGSAAACHLKTGQYTKQTRNLKDILRDFTNIKHRNDIKWFAT